MSAKKTLQDYPDVSFIDNMTIEDIQTAYLSALEEKYLELTGKKLEMAQADPLRLIAYADCLLLYQVAQYADRAGKMALLKYSYGDYLDNIGALKGIQRTPGAAARTNILITLSAKRNHVTIIPQGTRVTAGDGKYFETTEILEIPAGRLQGEVIAVCKEIGTIGNGYQPGEIKILVDPVPYVDKIENTSVAEGGADLETDENLAERIYLAPSSWSTAGPDDAYKYWVKTFDPAITDVRVDSDVPGQVDIRFLLQDGQLPDEAMTEELAKYLQNEDIRPLTDHVVVQAPTKKEYEISLTYYVNESDRTKANAIQSQIQTAVQEYVDWQKEKIGRDINPDQLRKMIVSAGAKRVELTLPAFEKISKADVAVLKGDAVILYGGVEDD